MVVFVFDFANLCLFPVLRKTGQKHVPEKRALTTVK